MTSRPPFRAIDPGGVADGDYVVTVAGGVVTGLSLAGAGGGGIESIVPGTGISVDSTDPANPIVSATGTGGGAVSGARAGLSSSQPLTSGSFVVVNWTAETFDTDGYHSTSSNTSRLVIPSGMDGYFELTASIYFSYISGASGGERVVQIRKNGVAGNTGVVGRSDGTSSGSHGQIAVTGPIPLVAGDYLQVEAYHDSGGSWEVKAENYSFFTIMRR